MQDEGNNGQMGTQLIESLRDILTSKQERAVTYSEAEEVGESLIKFFELLAGDPDTQANPTQISGGGYGGSLL